MHRLEYLSAQTSTSVIVTIVVFTCVVIVAVSGFDVRLQTAFATGCAAVTVTMLFVAQHTQRRAQTAVQLKLDELVRALPAADNRMVGVEAAPVAELSELALEKHDLFEAIRDESTGSF